MNERQKLSKADHKFYEAIKTVLEEQQLSGKARPVYKDGTEAKSFYINGYSTTYDLSKGEFPITTLRPIAWRSAIKEILWIYSDQTNSLDVLQNKYNVKYWNSWEVPNEVANNGDHHSIGFRYGAVVRKHDIINKILKQLEENPWNRRNVISLWDYDAFEETEGLLPCAFLIMFDVREKDGEIYLDCSLIQRSNDMLVAHHINAIQYVALQMMIACHFGWKVGYFNYFVNNLHIYDNQLVQAEELLNRYEELADSYINELGENIAEELFKKGLDSDLDSITTIIKEHLDNQQSEEQEVSCPKLRLNCPPKTNFYDIKIDDFDMENYYPILPQIKFNDLAI